MGCWGNLLVGYECLDKTSYTARSLAIMSCWIWRRLNARVLLTKDFELYKRAISRGLDAFYVEGKTESDRLAEVAKRYGVELVVDMDKSHCPICNTKLQAAPKEQLKDELEPNTYTYYDKFWKCPNCGQVYWQGAHWKQINGTLAQAQQKR